jgi:hypothetical protein
MLTKEESFFDKVHCKFPYHNKVECLKLIDEAVSLSPDDVFKVMEELCRIPVLEKRIIPTDLLIDLLNTTASKFNHPLKDIILDVSVKMVHGKELTVDDAISKMELVKAYPLQYSALSILYFSCDDKEGKLELIWSNILSEWHSNGYNEL